MTKRESTIALVAALAAALVASLIVAHDGDAPAAPKPNDDGGTFGHGQCLEPPQEAERWAYPTMVRGGSGLWVCAERALNNDGVFPRSHRCLRLVPCGWESK